VPFVQGRLREENISVTIKTQCAHCAQPLEIILDSELNYRVSDEAAKPLIFEPHINWTEFTEPNIIDAY
jgi:hypothetical protein